MIKRMLITGVCGFVGENLVDFLNSLETELEIYGIDLNNKVEERIYKLFNFDLSDSQDVISVMRQTKPDYILHIAGLHSDSNIESLYSANVLSLINLLEAAVEFSPKAVFVAIGSSAEYGNIGAENLPIFEHHQCKPVSYYGLTKKIATDILCYYVRVSGICGMVVRPFQLIGKGISYKLAPGAFANQIKEIKMGKKEGIIKTGNLSSTRDFIDVKDAVEALWALCNRPASGEIFNLCSGRQIKMRDLLRMMIEYAGLDSAIEEDKERFKLGSSASLIYGSYEKIRKHCNWHPKRTLIDSVKDIIKDDR